MGKNDFELYPTEYAIISIDEDKQVFMTGTPILNKETKSVRKDRTEISFLSSKIPFRNDQNEIAGLIGMSYEITWKMQNDKTT